jgi:hypothetical protein
VSPTGHKTVSLVTLLFLSTFVSLYFIRITVALHNVTSHTLKLPGVVQKLDFSPFLWAGLFAQLCPGGRLSDASVSDGPVSSGGGVHV